MARIYTRTGDKGETGLVGGSRVSKDSLRVDAYGSVDELNSVLGIARAFLKDRELDDLLAELQKDLFVVGADLASSSDHQQRNVPRITAEKIASMEQTIDKFEVELSPLRAFILPGGGVAGSILHNARTVARRAERRVVTLSKAESINERMVPYMNRLSDLLFVMARVANHRENKGDIEWHARQ
ncbi:MAG: cob(I)yrinic acid a,c-diamide adenosyltransferase [Candidatus Bathyarchaeia archaeon]